MAVDRSKAIKKTGPKMSKKDIDAQRKMDMAMSKGKKSISKHEK